MIEIIIPQIHPSVNIENTGTRSDPTPIMIEPKKTLANSPVEELNLPRIDCTIR